MKQTELSAIAEELLEFVEASSTALCDDVAVIDGARFVDPVRHERERQMLFLETPQVVGLSCDLPGPGSFLTQLVAGVPVLLVRGRDGAVRGYLNACRHRGTTVVEGCGSARRFTCPWHAWTYDDTGALVGVPFVDGFDRIDRGDFGLIPVPTCERYGMLFVLPSPGREFDIDDYLGELGPELGSFGFDTVHRVDVREVGIDVNWKLANDTGFEVYHVSFLHKDSVGPLNVANTAAFRWYGRNHRMAIPSPSITELRSQPREEWDPLQHLQLIYNIFPSSAMVVSNLLIALTRIEPGPTPGESHYRFSTYSWTPLDDEAVSQFATMAFEGLYTVVMNEDYVAAGATQRNLEAGAPSIVLAGRNEPAIQRVHQAYDEVIGHRRADDAGSVVAREDVTVAGGAVPN